MGGNPTFLDSHIRTNNYYHNRVQHSTYSASSFCVVGGLAPSHFRLIFEHTLFLPTSIVEIREATLYLFHISLCYGIPTWLSFSL